jgi:hypothetical protein
MEESKEQIDCTFHNSEFELAMRPVHQARCSDVDQEEQVCLILKIVSI